MKKLILLVSIPALMLGLFATEVVLGSGTATQRFPLGSYFSFERSVALYTAAEIGAQNTRISAVSWYTGLAINLAVPTKIYLKSTSASTLTNGNWATMISGATLLYDQTQYGLVANGWNLFALNSTFDVDLGDNLMILVERNVGGNGGGPSGGYFQGAKVHSTTMSNAHLAWFTTPEPPTGNAYVQTIRPNVKLTYTTYSAVTPPNAAQIDSPAHNATNVLLNATLNWFSGGGAPTGYRLNLGTDNPPTNIINNADFGDVLTYNPGGLAYSHTYYWQVIPYNSNGPATGCPIWSFTTMNDPSISSFPHTENFDGTWVSSPAAPLGWKVINADANAYTWRQGNSYIEPTHSEPYAALGTGNQNDYLITPPIDLTDVSVRMKWWDKVESESHSNSYKVLLSTTDTQTASFTVELADIVCTNTVWTEHSLNLDAYAGQTVYIALYQYASDVLDWGFAIDDFRLEEIPQAPIFAYAPTAIDFSPTRINELSAYQNVSVSNPGAGTLYLSAADLSLMGTNADDFYFDAAVFPLALTADQSANILVRFSPSSLGAKSTTLRISYSGTAYDVALSGIGIRTNAIYESFEGQSFPPADWTIAVLDEDGDHTWARNTNFPRTGLACAYIGSEMEAHDDWLITPCLAITEDDYTFSFWASNHEEYYGTIYIDTFNVKVSSQSNDASDFTNIIASAVAPPAGVYMQYSYDLSAFIGSNVFVTIQAIGADGMNLYIDDVLGPEIYVAPIPPEPVTLVAPANGALNLPRSGFELSWTPALTGGVPTSYSVFLASSVETIFDEYLFDVQGTSFNPVLDGNMSFNYDERWFWTVEATNSYGSSVQDGPFQFLIEEDHTISSLPWSESFEAAQFPPLGWQVRDEDADGQCWLQHDALDAAHTGLHSATSASYLNNVGPLTPDNWLITPPVVIPSTQEYIVEYYVGAQDQIYPVEHYGFYVSTSSSALENFTLWHEETLEDADWHHRMFNLSAFAGETLYFAFRHFNSTNQFYIKIDDIAVLEVPQDPSLSYNPAAWDFGVSHTMTPATPKNFVLSNTGAGTITINGGDIALNDPEGNFLLIAENLPAALTGNQAYTFSVQFIPQSPGIKTATLTIEDNLTRIIHSISLSGEAVAEPLAGITGLNAEALLPNHASLSWSSIYGEPGTPGYLHWDDSIYRNSIGAEANSYHVAVKFGTGAMASSAGMALTNVMIHLHEAPQTVDFLKIWSGNESNYAPSSLLYQQAVSGLSTGWNNIVLDSPLTVSGNSALYVGYHISGIEGAFPASIDGLSPVDGYGNLVELGSWNTLASAGLSGNWMIHAYFDAAPAPLSRRLSFVQPIPVMSEPIAEGDLRKHLFAASSSATMDRALRGFNIYRNGTQINSDILAAYSYLDESLAPGTYSYAVQAVHFSTLGPLSSAVSVDILPPPAPYVLPFMEDWDSEDFYTNLWTITTNNWDIDDSFGNPAPAAIFGWYPPLTDYNSALRSYDLDATGMSGVHLSFDLYLDSFSTAAENLMSWEIWDGEIWNSLGSYSSLNGDLAWTTYSYDISAHASDRVFKIRFVASGEDSYEINYWYIDNIAFTELPATLNPISDLSIARSGANVVLSWTAVPGAAWYMIYASENPYGGFEPLDMVETAEASLPAASLPVSKAFIKVTAGIGTPPRANLLVSPAAKK